MSKKQVLKIVILIVAIILILMMLTKCGGKKPTTPEKEEEVVVILNHEQAILTEMKEDELLMIGLFERGDICSEQWIEEFIDLAKKFQNYSYLGNKEDVVELVDQFKEYGEKLEIIGNEMKEKKYEQSIKSLEATESEAEEIEGELSRLYGEYN